MTEHRRDFPPFWTTVAAVVIGNLLWSTLERDRDTITAWAPILGVVFVLAWLMRLWLKGQLGRARRGPS